jgi:hypothetical protein
LDATGVDFRLIDDDDKVSTPDAAALDITGDIDIRFDAALDVWKKDGFNDTEAEIVGKYSRTSDERSWLVTIDDGYIKLITSPDGTFTNAIEHLATVPLLYGYGERVAIKITLDVNNGAGGHTVTFYTSDTISGVWTQLGDAVVTTGTTSLYSGTSELRIGRDTTGAWHTGSGLWYAFQLRSGIDGAVVANPDFTAQTAGATSFADAAGLTWTLSGNAEFYTRNDRFIGEIADFIPIADISGSDRTVSVIASGALRRLQQGESPLLSPIYRGILRLEPHAYWPLEDESGATSLAALSANTVPMAYVGSPTLASYDGFAPNKSILVINNSRLTGIVSKYVNTGEIQVRFLIYFPASGMANNDIVCSIATTGALARIDLQWLTGGGLRLLGYDSDGTVSHTGGTLGFDAIDKTWRISIELAQNGADVDWSLFAINPSSDQGGGSDTFAGVTMGRCTKVIFNPDRNIATTVAIGHVTMETAINIYAFSAQAYELDAWNLERASSRIARLCKEEGFSSVFKRDYDTSNMGPQTASSLVSLLRECESADNGILFEPRHIIGVSYIGRRALYSRPASIELDCAANELSQQLAPSYDDSTARNDVTISRSGGSSARYFVSATERYDESLTLNLYDDDSLAGHAEWRVHLGTVEGARFPRISVNRARSQIVGDATLDQQILDLDIGDRIDILNPGVWASYEDISLIIVGISEYISNFEHTIDFNCMPYEPYNVGVYDDTASRYDTEGTTLATPVEAYKATFAGAGTRSYDTTDITGDIDIRCKASLNDWTPAARQTLVAKYQPTGNQRSWRFQVISATEGTTGCLRLYWSNNGSAALFATSTAATGLADGSVKWCRATLDVNNGAAGCDVKFYLSDDGVSWTQLGSTVTQAFTTSIFDSTALYQIGAGDGAALGQPLSGVIYGVQVISGLAGGTSIVPFYVEDWTDGYSGSATGGAATSLVTSNGFIAISNSTGNEWTTTDTDFPLDLRINGERITVADCTGTGASQVFTTCTRSVNGVTKRHAEDDSVRLADPVYYGL